MERFQIVLNEEIYQTVVREEIPGAKKFLWIVTADLKDLHVEGPSGRFVPFLSILAELVRAGVDVRLIHAKEPGPRFREDFDRFPELVNSDRFERILCPRNHMKLVIVDGRIAYMGSANLTGAGMGAKSPSRRNFESGVIMREAGDIQPLMDFVDQLYLGEFCTGCGRRDVCPDPIA